jgi:hypothetical protein
MQPLYEFKMRPQNRVYQHLNKSLSEFKKLLGIVDTPPPVQRLLYRALVTQSGTGDPVATVIENNTGVSISFERQTNGFYDINASSPVFLEGKVLINNIVVTTFTDAYASPQIIRFDDSAGYFASMKAQRNNNSQLTIFFLDESANLPVEWSDALLCLSDNPLYLEIEILP